MLTADRLTRLDDIRDRARIALEDARGHLSYAADRARLRLAGALRDAAYLLDADAVTMDRTTFDRWRSMSDKAVELIDDIREITGVQTWDIKAELRRLKSLDR